MKFIYFPIVANKKMMEQISKQNFIINKLNSLLNILLV